MRKIIFKWAFSTKEQTAIINALYRRAADLSTSKIEGDEIIRLTCDDIAKELMS